MIPAAAGIAAEAYSLRTWYMSTYAAMPVRSALRSWPLPSPGKKHLAEGNQHARAPAR